MSGRFTGGTPGSGEAPPARRAERGWRRALVGAAGLLAAGVTVWGVALLAVQLAAPSVADGADSFGRADGPGWDRALAHLLVGAAGVVLLRLGSRRSRTAAAVIAGGVVVAVLVLLWWAWWS